MSSEAHKRWVKKNPPKHCDHCQTLFTKRKEMHFDDHMWFCELCRDCPDRWYVGYEWCQIHYQDITLEEVHYNMVEHRRIDYDFGGETFD